MKYFTKEASVPKALMWAAGGAIPGAGIGAGIGAAASSKDKKLKGALIGAGVGAGVGAAAGVGAGYGATSALRSKLMRGSGMVPTGNTRKMRAIEKHVIEDMNQVYKNISDKYLFGHRVASPLDVIKANKAYIKNKHKMSADMLEIVGVKTVQLDRIKLNTKGKPKYLDIHDIPPKYTEEIRRLKGETGKKLSAPVSAKAVPAVPTKSSTELLQESVLNARRSGVPEDKILKTKADIDKYFRGK